MISILMIPHLGKSQEQGSFEQYYYTGSGTSVIVPKIYLQNKNNWFGEVRYNYEELETVSLNAGKMFSSKNDISYSFKPYAGLVLGRMSGGTLGSNVSLDYRDLFFSSESQYSFSVNEKAQDFFFNWSELGYQFSNLLYSGFALQVTHPFEIRNNWEPGVMLGVTYKNWTFPFYTFSPISVKRNYVLGVNWEWNYKNYKTSNPDLLTIH
ncbi:MAG: hypothetical protein ABI683_14735 [Ginsengibacter sp.]